jgi:rhamnogalacturonyl hydrolase YesR
MNVSRPAFGPRPANVVRAQAQSQAPAPASAPQPSQGLPETGLSHLWGPLRGAIVMAQDLASTVTNKFQKHPAPTNPDQPGARAKETWEHVRTELGFAPSKGLFREKAGSLTPATVWPYGQAMAAGLDVAQLTGDYTQVKEMAKGLSNYLKDGAYAPGPFGGNRLWDDNAWVGLDLVQAFQQTKDPAYLKQAEDLFPFMLKGLSKEGGTYWEENNPRMTRNSCANGPAVEFALRLYAATKKPQYLDYAKNLDATLNGKLRSPEGLYYDNLGDDGKLDKSIFSYNQGAALGADVQWYKLTGDKKYLERAQQTAKASLEYFGKDDRLWKASPAFNAIFFRNLLALDAVAPNPAYRQALGGYLDRLWKEARNPKTGLFTEGGIGKYDSTPASLLDQSGIAQLFALQAWRKEDIDKVS